MNIKNQLTAFGIAVAAFVLVLSLCYHIILSYGSGLRSRTEAAETLAELVAYNSVGALSFQDKTTATRILTGLQLESSIVSASLSRKTGDVLASYKRAGVKKPDLSALLPIRDGLERSWKVIRLTRNVESDNHSLGKVEIIISLDDLNSQLVFTLLASIATLLTGTLIASAVARALQGRITAPLFRLLSAMKTIAKDKDYRHRIERTSPDEFGLLIGNFNSMLDEIQKRDDVLETTVQERTNSLREALARTTAASHAKSQFLANMSHEIRTPLTGIVGMIEVLKDEHLDQAQLELVGHLTNSADSLLGLVNDILDFSRIEEGKLDLDRREFSTHQLIQDLSDGFSLQAKENGLTLIIETAADLPASVIGDRMRIHQVLLNLVSNAMKFTGVGGAVVVQCWLNRASESVGRLNFSVSDTGIGIPSDKLSLIFDSFTQADGTVTRKYGGSGLGLAIVRRLVRLMGGDVKVASREDIGTCFHFYVRVEMESALDEKQELLEEEELLPPPQLSGLRVLVAEDNRVNQRLAEKLLLKMGHIVALAENGKEAVEMCRKKEFDLILMDIQMPVMDGLDATTLIRQSFGPWGKSVPIIGISAHAFRDDVDRSTRVGMTDYITKPFKADDLRRRIEDAIMFSL